MIDGEVAGGGGGGGGGCKDERGWLYLPVQHTHGYH